MKYEGRVWKLGDSLDTDQIIPARFLNIPDPEELRKHCLEDARSDFVREVKQGDFVVGGNNFGCGSSREEAPAVLKDNGIVAVIAKSFARIFLRNAINIGLTVIECPLLVDETKDGDFLYYDQESGEAKNLSTNKSYVNEPMPEFLQNILDVGGLIEYVKKELR